MKAMKTPSRKNSKFLQTAVKLALLTGLCATSQQILAAEWSLAQHPLYLGSSVPANVLLLVDDSGSMDWEIMSKDLVHDGLFYGTQQDVDKPLEASTIKGRDTNGDGSPDCKVGGGYRYGVGFTSINSNDNCDIADDREWRFRNHDYSSFYFNPQKNYLPWPGFNADGVTLFKDMPINAARANPWDGWRGLNETIDLTKHNSALPSGPNREISKDWDKDGQPDGFRYYTWSDKNNNSLFDNGEETEHQIRKESIDIQQKFANWFSYYRSRHLIAKSAFGRLIANINGLRVGMATLHNNSDVNTPLRLIDSTAAGEANRKTLLSNLYRMDPNQGTPLQNTLKQGGEYLSGKSNSLAVGTDAALPEALGGSCQQNFTLLMTDGFYNGTYNDNNPTIGNADGDANSKFDKAIDKSPFPQYGDNAVKTLGDIAMYYYENDISVAPDKVPTLAGVDEAKHQHMVTYTVAFGVSGHLKGMPEDYDAHKEWGAWPGWPSGSSADDFSDLQKIDDLRHAAYNGRGEFLEANDPDSLVNSLTQVINSIQGRTASSTSAAFNATSLRNNTVVFQSRYSSADWHGELLFKPINLKGDIGAAIADAGVLLTQTDDVSSQDPALRRIITRHATTGKGIAFRMTDLAPAQQLAVGSQQVLDYLRGERACELGYIGKRVCALSKNKRTRSSTLGDIINSSPVYVGAPNGAYTDDPDYINFIKKVRTPVVYVGANDGMLHGFDASVTSTGGKTANTAKELIAYVPGAVYKNLAALTSIPYTHKYVVDATPVVADAKFSDGWHSILLGGLRGGGQAMFALDVTDPSNFDEAKAEQLVRWEFSDNNDADLGYTYGEPAITKMANGEWAAVFGNGYNNTEADGNASTTGNAALYIVHLQTGALIAKISTGFGSSKDPEGLGRPNGLSGVRVADVDADGVADFIYAGDLFGNLWRFDVTGSAPTGWSTGSGTPLFTALSVEGKMQSITTRPAIGPHENGASKGYMVYFGTGKFLENADNSAVGQPTQSFYALWDKWPKGTSGITTINKANLLQQTILSETALGQRISSNTVIDWSTKQGWYMDLKVTGATSNNGERVIFDPLLRNGQILFSTFTPIAALCTSDGGGYVMIVNAASGSRPLTPPIDLNGDTFFDEKDLVTSGGISAAATGYKSTHGAPSAPTLVEGVDGIYDMVVIAYQDGEVDGVPGGGGGADAANPKGSPIAPGVLKGRLTWKRLK